MILNKNTFIILKLFFLVILLGNCLVSCTPDNQSEKIPNNISYESLKDKGEEECSSKDNYFSEINTVSQVVEDKNIKLKKVIEINEFHSSLFPSIKNNYIYLNSNPIKIYDLNSGKLIKKTEVHPGRVSLILDDSLVMCNGPDIWVVSTETWELKWEYHFTASERSIIYPPASKDDKLFVATQAFIKAFNLYTGDVIYEYYPTGTMGAGVSNLIILKDTIYINANNYISAFSIEKEKELWSLKIGEKLYGGELVMLNNSLYLIEANTLYSIDTNMQKVKWSTTLWDTKSDVIRYDLDELK